MEPKFTYVLNQPVKDDKGFELTELSIRQATVGDLISSESQQNEGGEQKKTIKFFAVLAGLNPQILEKIYLKDWLAFVKGANDFLGIDSAA